MRFLLVEDTIYRIAILILFDLKDFIYKDASGR